MLERGRGLRRKKGLLTAQLEARLTKRQAGAEASRNRAGGACWGPEREMGLLVRGWVGWLDWGAWGLRGVVWG